MPKPFASSSDIPFRQNPRTSTNSSAIASRSWSVADLPGMSDDNCQRLHECQIETTQQLLARTQTSENQNDLAAQLKVHLQYLKKWVALADLSRIPTVGCQHCGLLLHAGIISPAHLVRTPLPRLHQQLVKLHVAELRNKDQCPSLSDVRSWQHQARYLQSF